MGSQAQPPVANDGTGTALESEVTQMTKEELAAKLDGNRYGAEITGALEMLAKSSGLVVVFGYSDDNMEFRGAIDDEVGCYDGGSAFILDGELIGEDECESQCRFFKAAMKRAVEIKALWCKEKPYSWTYKTKIPHATFDIFEDGERSCRGIVFDLGDTKAS